MCKFIYRVLLYKVDASKIYVCVGENMTYRENWINYAGGGR